MEERVCCKCQISKPIEEFSWNNIAKGRRNFDCKVCHKKHRNKFYLANKEKEALASVEARDIVKEWFENYKSTLKCSRCDESHIATLCFHHIDPSTKEMNVSETIGYRWSIKRIQKEIDKCIVLCANCHAKEHYVLRGH